MFIVIIIIIMGQKPMQLLEPLLATGQESQCKERENWMQNNIHAEKC